ncbi:MAG: MCE family protein [Vicinamibacteria bacterium]|nr:MCE family protein [Vicinamibacteria bacterium]
MTEKDDVHPKPALRGRYREAWVGVFVLIGFISAMATLFMLTDPSLFRGRYILKTTVTDAAGIRRGDPVQLRGVNIGRVISFRIAPEGVNIDLEIEGEYDVPSGSRVEIKMNSIMGGLSADIIPGDSSTMLRDGDSLPGGRTAGIFDSAGKIADQSDLILKQARAALSDETVKNIQSGSADMRKLLTELHGTAQEQRRVLKDLTSSLKRSAAGIENAATRPELERTIARLDELTSRLDATTGSLQRSSASLENVLARIDNGEGTLGRLSKDETLYNNINDTADNINKLIADMRKNPRKYLKLSLF